jgi:hypothetical protein
MSDRPVVRKKWPTFNVAPRTVSTTGDQTKGLESGSHRSRLIMAGFQSRPPLFDRLFYPAKQHRDLLRVELFRGMTI